MLLLGGAVFAAALAIGAGRLSAADLVTRAIVPSEIDPAVKDFNDPNVVIFDPAAPPTRPLAIFMSGTRGKPEKATGLLNVIAEQGYRVIGLEYDDVPAVQKICPQNPDPACAEAFRAMRVYGKAATASPVDNPQAEAVVTRLTALLTALDKRYPAEGWGGYLKDGAPDWSRMVVCGLSQGAGMAAFIAKRQPVFRAVLFSSPWDFTGPDRTPSPWLSQPSATPPERWYAEYHKREKTADAIQKAYAALAIPADHILVFDRDLQSADPPKGRNPFHPSTIRDLGYAPQWRQMFGSAL